jgi:hypothetical protein
MIFVIQEILIDGDTLVVVEGPMPRILSHRKLLPDRSYLFEIFYNCMFSGYPELARDVFEVFSEAHNPFNQGITNFVYLISFIEQLVPFLALLVPAVSVLRGRVEMSLELIDTVLAVDLPIIGARLYAALVLLDLASATAQRHLYSLTLIAEHNI